MACSSFSTTDGMALITKVKTKECQVSHFACGVT